MLRFAKIIVKDNYEKKGDLVFRPLIRAYNKIDNKVLMEDGNALLIGILDNDDVFYELFTGNYFYASNYVEISMEEFAKYRDNLSNDDIAILEEIINRVVFKKTIPVFDKKNIVFEHVNAPDYSDEQKRIQEEDEDLRIEYRAYQDGFSLLDPFDKDNLNGYRDFLYRVSLVNEYANSKNIKKS